MNATRRTWHGWWGGPRMFLVGVLGGWLGTGACARAYAQAVPVVGQVVEAGSGRAVVGAVVRVDTLEAETDEFGMFQLSGLEAGRYVVRVVRLGYEDVSVALVLEAGRPARVRLTLTERAIELSPLSVEALSADSLRGRGAGYSRRGVTRAQLAQWEGTNMTVADVLRTSVPSVRVRRLERVVGSDVCIELRSLRATNANACLSPAVYLDGVPITNPTMLFATLQIAMVESMEIVPAAEAGVRFGTGALYGALLIDTRRPGGSGAGAQGVRRVNFDWSEDPQGHRTTVVLVAAALGSAAGVGLGAAAAGECLHLREPARDAIVTECGLLMTLGTGAAAVVLPALGSSVATRLSGQTQASRGRWLPAAVASAMLVLPGYALVLSGERNESDAMQWIGRGLIAVGSPVASTLSDYLFRDRRN